MNHHSFERRDGQKLGDRQGFLSVPARKGPSSIKTSGPKVVSNTNTANEILGNFETFLDFTATGSRKNDSIATDNLKNLNLKQVTLFKG